MEPEQTLVAVYRIGKRGYDPTPETIRQGTVRMEEHPQYTQTIADIEARGYKVVPTQESPCVIVREIVDEQGIVLRVEREVQVRLGMTFLDLEHEIGHLDQIDNQLKGAMLPTERILELGVPSGNQNGLYERWMDAVSEYHNRLVEYKRLYERGIDEDVLQVHAQEVCAWRERYAKIVRGMQYGSSKAASRIAWTQTFFPDIGELATAYREAGGEKMEQDWR